MKFLAATITALVQLTAAAIGLLLLLLVLNGYSERQAAPGLAIYIVLALVSSLALGAASAIAVGRLTQKRSLGSLAALAIAVLGSLVVGGVLLITASLAVVILAEAIREMK